jgi:hypothetical protein
MQQTHTNTNITPRSPRRLARQALLVGAVLVTALAMPAVASAADTLVAPDLAADEVTALDGTIVWVSGAFGNQTLMQRDADGIAPVKGAPKARSYRSIDLGRDSKNRLVLTYQRCDTRCKTLTDNLDGKRASFKHLTLKRCGLTTAPARWRARTAYGLLCRKPNNQADDSRSGLYVKYRSGTIKRLPLPKDAKRFGVTDIASVDLRGTEVAAVAADNYEFAFVQRTNGKKMRSIFAAASEGDSDAHVNGLALGSSATMWALTNSEHAGDPNRALVFRVGAACYELETLTNPPGPNQQDGFLATDLAVDGSRLYLVVPGKGIVAHPFVPQGGCTRL